MDDPRVQRTSGPDAVVPKRAQLEQWLLGVLDATLITCIIEAKESLSPEDQDRWVGHVELYFEPGVTPHTRLTDDSVCIKAAIAAIARSARPTLYYAQGSMVHYFRDFTRRGSSPA
jgi:hypothetical protein